jgi:hypothetical protein
MRAGEQVCIGNDITRHKTCTWLQKDGMGVGKGGGGGLGEPHSNQAIK